MSTKLQEVVNNIIFSWKFHLQLVQSSNFHMARVKFETSAHNNCGLCPYRMYYWHTIKPVPGLYARHCICSSTVPNCVTSKSKFQSGSQIGLIPQTIQSCLLNSEIEFLFCWKIWTWSVIPITILQLNLLDTGIFLPWHLLFINKILSVLKPYTCSHLLGNNLRE